MYNPLEDNLGNAYPMLIDIFGELTGDTIRILRYAMSCYDPGSPLIQDYQDWMARKTSAAGIAGFDLDNEGDLKYLGELFIGANPDALEIIHKYLRKCVKSREWAMIVSNEDTFWEYNHRLKQPITTGTDADIIKAVEKKSKISADQEIIHERIKRYEKDFWGGDEEMIQAAEVNRGLNPQKIAKQLSKK